jgi:hypothetical protein
VNLKAKKFMQLQGGGRYKSFKLSCQIGLRKVCLSGGEPQQLVFSLGQEGEILKQQSSPPGPGTIWTDGWTPVNRLLLGVIEVRYDHMRRCWDAKKGFIKINVRRARGDAKLCNVEIDYSTMLNNEKMDCRLEKQVSIKSGLLLGLKYTISLLTRQECLRLETIEKSSGIAKGGSSPNTFFQGKQKERRKSTTRDHLESYTKLHAKNY